MYYPFHGLPAGMQVPLLWRHICCNLQCLPEMQLCILYFTLHKNPARREGSCNDFYGPVNSNTMKPGCVALFYFLFIIEHCTTCPEHWKFNPRTVYTDKACCTVNIMIGWQKMVYLVVSISIMDSIGIGWHMKTAGCYLSCYCCDDFCTAAVLFKARI